MSRPTTFASLAAPVLRHRILVNYRAEAEGVVPERGHSTFNAIIRRLLETVKEAGCELN
jgi:MoxR-like ATPase